MRTDKKISDRCIAVGYDSEVNKLYIRRPGKDNKNELRLLAKIEDDALIIDENTLSEYGLHVSFVKGGA